MTAGARARAPLRWARPLLLAAVGVCAACGLVYELALVALGSYLVGDTVANAALVISLMVFAMGLGSLAAKPLQRWPAAAFAGVELALALVGGTSVLVLYASYSWLRLYTPALIVVTAILTSDDAIGRGLISTVVYGAMGILLMGVSFLLLDAVTPGKLGETVTEHALHPAAWVTAVVHLAVAGIIAASVT